MNPVCEETYGSLFRDRLAFLLYSCKDKPIPLAYQGYLLGQDTAYVPLLYQIFTRDFGLMLDELFREEYVNKREPNTIDKCSLAQLHENIKWCWTHIPLFQCDVDKYKDQLKTSNIFTLRELSRLFGYSMHELCTSANMENVLKQPNVQFQDQPQRKKGILQLSKIPNLPNDLEVQFVSVTEVPSFAHDISIRSQSQIFGGDNPFIQQVMRQIPRCHLKLPKTCFLFHCNEGKMCYVKKQISIGERKVYVYLLGGANSLCGAFDAILTNTKLLYRFCIWLIINQHPTKKELYLQLFESPATLPAFCQLQMMKNRMRLYRVFIDNAKANQTSQVNQTQVNQTQVKQTNQTSQVKETSQRSEPTQVKKVATNGIINVLYKFPKKTTTQSA